MARLDNRYSCKRSDAHLVYSSLFYSSKNHLFSPIDDVYIVLIFYSLFQIIVQQKPKDSGLSAEVKTAKLSMIGNLLDTKFSISCFESKNKRLFQLDFNLCPDFLLLRKFKFSALKIKENSWGVRGGVNWSLSTHPFLYFYSKIHLFSSIKILFST